MAAKQFVCSAIALCLLNLVSASVDACSDGQCDRQVPNDHILLQRGSSLKKTMDSSASIASSDKEGLLQKTDSRWGALGRVFSGSSEGDSAAGECGSYEQAFKSAWCQQIGSEKPEITNDAGTENIGNLASIQACADHCCKTDGCQFFLYKINLNHRNPYRCVTFSSCDNPVTDEKLSTSVVYKLVDGGAPEPEPEPEPEETEPEPEPEPEPEEPEPGDDAEPEAPESEPEPEPQPEELELDEEDDDDDNASEENVLYYYSEDEEVDEGDSMEDLDDDINEEEDQGGDDVVDEDGEDHDYDYYEGEDGGEEDDDVDDDADDLDIDDDDIDDDDDDADDGEDEDYDYEYYGEGEGE